MMRAMNPSQVIDAVCAFYKVTFPQINSASHTREAATVRQEMMCLLREFTGLTFKSIGDLFGGRDHKAVMNAVAKVTTRAVTEPEYADRVDQLRRFVSAYDPAPYGAAAIDHARRCMATAPESISADVRGLGMTILMTASVLSSPALTDAEARQAALQILNRGGRDAAAA